MTRVSGPKQQPYTYSCTVTGVLTFLMLVFSVHAQAISPVVLPAPDRLTPDRKSAERLLLQGRIDDSIAQLKRILAISPQDGPANLLLCRAFYAEDHTDAAIAACVLAVQAMPQNSDAQDRLGRAFGMKADNSGPIEGFKLARKVKLAFETAVSADPANGWAVNDLSEYYVGAPAIVGGGLDKADALATSADALLPQQAHRIRALAAEKRKDYGTAEREFQSAVDVAKRPDALADLGGFYARRKQLPQALDALHRCLATDRAKDAAIVDAASILDEIHLESRLAIATLQQYLNSNARSDDAPAPKVHLMLGKMLTGVGDTAGAKIEFGKALELAADYTPARRALEHP